MVGSWLLIHIFAAFGFFVALAYPIWNLILPVQGKLPCLGCAFKRDGDYCPVCKRTVDRNNRSPRSLAAVLKNVGIIFAFSLISLIFIFVESTILKSVGIPATPKTVSFTIPTQGQYRLGEVFPMKIELSGIKTPINAIQADIRYDTTKVEVVDISTEESFASIFIQKEVNNVIGYARLTGGLPNPGYALDKGTFGVVYLRGKEPGPVEVIFMDSSMVLANDGRGTNVLKDFGSVSYLILPEEMPEDAQAKQEVVLGSEVLGEETTDTRLYLYDEGVNVLGTDTEKLMEDFEESTESSASSSAVTRAICTFWGYVSTFNSVIIKFWETLLTLSTGQHS